MSSSPLSAAMTQPRSDRAETLVLGCHWMLDAAGEREFTILGTPPQSLAAELGLPPYRPQARWRSDGQGDPRSGH